MHDDLEKIANDLIKKKLAKTAPAELSPKNREEIISAAVDEFIKNDLGAPDIEGFLERLKESGIKENEANEIYGIEFEKALEASEKEKKGSTPTAQPAKKAETPKTSGKKDIEDDFESRGGFEQMVAETSEIIDTKKHKQEKIEIKKEIENLSPEERVEISKGFYNLGFRFEKRKNEYIANILGEEHKNSKNKQNRVARWIKGLQNTYIKEAESAEQKAKDAAAGKGGWRMKLQNPGLLIGSLIRSGRIITDATGLSLASPLRYMMMISKGVTRLGKAGKEARLLNEEEVIKKTRIDDANLAEEEAWKIYERAKEKGDVSAEALKKAYLMEMPKDLLKRLQNPSAANTFIQNRLKSELLGYKFKGHVVFEGAISRLNKDIEKIEKGKLSPEEKEAQIEALLRRQEDNLKDWDRIITQYGTVDGWAVAGRYLETIGKAGVAGMTTETLILSVDRLFEWVSSHDIHPIDGTGKFIKGIFSGEKADEKVKIPIKPYTAPAEVAPVAPADAPASAPTSSLTPTTSPTTPEPIIPETPQAINNFTSEGVKFENGKGGIQGVWELLKQKDPNTTYAQAIEEAKKFGFYKPNGEESALIWKGSTLKFDDNGNIIFHDAKTGKDVSSYAGKMFDSDGSAKIPTKEPEYVTDEDGFVFEKTPEDDASGKIMIKNGEVIESNASSAHVTDEDGFEFERQPEDDASGKIVTKDGEIVDSNSVIDEDGFVFEKVPEDGASGDIQTKTPPTAEPTPSTASEPTPEETLKTTIEKQIDAGTVQMRTTYETGMKVNTGNVVSTGGFARVGSGSGYFNNQLQNLPFESKLIVDNHPEFFVSNPYGLSGEKLIEVYNTSRTDLGIVFENKISISEWEKLGDMKAGKILEYASDDEKAKHLSNYLNLLKNSTGLEPKSGFLGMGAESSEYYIARCLQNLVAGRGKVSLEEFETILRK